MQYSEITKGLYYDSFYDWNVVSDGFCWWT